MFVLNECALLKIVRMFSAMSICVIVMILWCKPEHTCLAQSLAIQTATCTRATLQAARKIHTGKFRAGKVNLMIVTDVAARGIDIPLLDNVINFDFPAKPKLFVHRVGRAARAGRLGTAYSLLTGDELPYLIDLHLFLSRPLIPAPVRSLQQAAAAASDLDPTISVYGTFPQVISHANIHVHVGISAVVVD